MSDIGLRGVAGLNLPLAAAGMGLLWLAASTIWATAVASRGTRTFGDALARAAAGPLTTLLIAGATAAWAWNGPTETVDEIGPLVAPLSLVLVWGPRWSLDGVGRDGDQRRPGSRRVDRTDSSTLRPSARQILRRSAR